MCLHIASAAPGPSALTPLRRYARTYPYPGLPATRFALPWLAALDWWESAEIGGLTIACTPAQHYSGRGIFDYKETFWSSWSIVGANHRVFYSGDTGFSDHFQLIGNRLGPFDLSIMRIGQYGPGASWIYSNMSPEHAVQAHQDVRASRMLPVHWGTFNIAFHDWDEPIRRAVEAADKNGVDLVTPRVGEAVIADQSFVSHDWWEEVRGVAIFAKACFGHPSPSKRQKLNATTYASGGPDSSSSPRSDPTRGRNIGSK